MVFRIILKELAEEVSYLLRNISRASIDSARLPKDWLTAKVSPVHVGGQPVNPKNLWPVSLTSTRSKAMERIIEGNIF